MTAAPLIDLAALRDRVRAALPSLTCQLVELEDSETRERYLALLIETEERKRDHVYRMTVAVIDDRVRFFVHVFGMSRDLTTQGTEEFSKKCDDIDEVFAAVHSCWSAAGAS